MPTPPERGGTKWTREGIEPAKAFWIEANAYRKAISEYINNPENDVPNRNRDDLLPLIDGLTNAVVGMRDALHEIELIGVKAKEDRKVNGESSQSQA